jgi:hypothetical protein
MDSNIRHPAIAALLFLSISFPWLEKLAEQAAKAGVPVKAVVPAKASTGSP